MKEASSAANSEPEEEGEEGGLSEWTDIFHN